MHQLRSQVEKQLELHKDQAFMLNDTPLEEFDWQELGGDKAG